MPTTSRGRFRSSMCRASPCGSQTTMPICRRHQIIRWPREDLRPRPLEAGRGETDLGLWNVYANPDFPAPQAGLWQITPALMGLTPPEIVNTAMNSHQFAFSGTDGVRDGTFYVLASTNLLLPTANWVVFATNTFDRHGHFSFSTPIVAEVPQTFYKLSLQMPTPAEVLPRTIALFKTPTLRDLGQSDPYLHTGRMNSIEDVIRFYQKFSNKAGAATSETPHLNCATYL